MRAPCDAHAAPLPPRRLTHHHQRRHSEFEAPKTTALRATVIRASRCCEHLRTQPGCRLRSTAAPARPVVPCRRLRRCWAAHRWLRGPLRVGRISAPTRVGRAPTLRAPAPIFRCAPHHTVGPVTAAAAAGLAWPLAARLETATPTRRGGLKERMFGPATARNRAQSSAHPPGRLRPAGLDPRRPFTGQTGGWTALGKPIPPRFHLNGGALARKDPAKRSGVPGSRARKRAHLTIHGTGAATPRAAVFVVTWRSRVRDSS